MDLPIDIFFNNLFNLTLGLIPVIVVAVVLAIIVDKLAKRQKEKNMSTKQERPTKIITNEDECFNCGCNLWKHCPGFKVEKSKKKKK